MFTRPVVATAVILYVVSSKTQSYNLGSNQEYVTVSLLTHNRTVSENQKIRINITCNHSPIISELSYNFNQPLPYTSGQCAQLLCMQYIYSNANCFVFIRCSAKSPFIRYCDSSHQPAVSPVHGSSHHRIMWTHWGIQSIQRGLFDPRLLFRPLWSTFSQVCHCQLY